jgi:hypothetical protein
MELYDFELLGGYPDLQAQGARLPLLTESDLRAEVAALASYDGYISLLFGDLDGPELPLLAWDLADYTSGVGNVDDEAFQANIYPRLLKLSEPELLFALALAGSAATIFVGDYSSSDNQLEVEHDTDYQPLVLIAIESLLRLAEAAGLAATLARKY